MTAPPRALVVGASSGIGHSIVGLLCRDGAAVVAAARRPDLLEELCAASGPRVHAVPCDVRDEAQCRQLVEEAAGLHGGLDTVVYAAGISPLGRLTATSAGVWHEVLATNLVGAGIVVASAIEHLRRSVEPTAVLLSSHSVGRPWPGLVPYAASKAALDELVLGLRAEEPWLRVVRVVVGPTVTPFAEGWSAEVAAPFFEQWADEGYLVHEVQEPAAVAAAVLASLGDRDGPDDLVVIGVRRTD